MTNANQRFNNDLSPFMHSISYTLNMKRKVQMIRNDLVGPPATYYYTMPDMPNNKRRFMYVLTNCPWYPFAAVNTDPLDINAYTH